MHGRGGGCVCVQARVVYACVCVRVRSYESTSTSGCLTLGTKLNEIFRKALMSTSRIDRLPASRTGVSVPTAPGQNGPDIHLKFRSEVVRRK